MVSESIYISFWKRKRWHLRRNLNVRKEPPRAFQKTRVRTRPEAK
jgi:hypothetical protein